MLEQIGIERQINKDIIKGIFCLTFLKDVKFIILISRSLGKLRMKSNLTIIQFVSVLLKIKVNFPL